MSIKNVFYFNELFIKFNLKAAAQVFASVKIMPPRNRMKIQDILKLTDVSIPSLHVVAHLGQNVCDNLKIKNLFSLEMA